MTTTIVYRCRIFQPKHAANLTGSPVKECPVLLQTAVENINPISENCRGSSGERQKNQRYDNSFHGHPCLGDSSGHCWIELIS